MGWTWVRPILLLALSWMLQKPTHTLHPMQNQLCCLSICLKGKLFSQNHLWSTYSSWQAPGNSWTGSWELKHRLHFLRGKTCAIRVPPNLILYGRISSLNCCWLSSKCPDWQLSVLQELQELLTHWFLCTNLYSGLVHLLPWQYKMSTAVWLSKTASHFQSNFKIRCKLPLR